MGEVVAFVAPGAVDDAWEAYRAHTAKSFDDPALGLDRSYMEQRARLHAKWVRVFLIDDRS